jgi:dipeptidyl aminopeptidase/acylaminoacyl peptidase
MSDLQPEPCQCRRPMFLTSPNMRMYGSQSDMKWASAFSGFSISGILSTLFVSCALCVLGGCGQKATHPELVGRAYAPALPLSELLSVGKTNSTYRVSPDGTKIAWLTGEGTNSGISFRALSGGETTHIRMPSTEFTWARDSRHLLYHASSDGGENSHIWLADTGKPNEAQQELTAWEGARADLVGLSHTSVSKIFVQYNKRDTKVFDLYVIDFLTGQDKLLEKNTGSIVKWLVNADDKVRARISQQGQKRTLEVREDSGAGSEAAQWRGIKTWDILDTFVPLEFADQGRVLWAQTNIEQDKIGLAKLDLASGALQWVYSDPKADLDVEDNAVKFGPRTREPLIAISEPDYPNNKVLQPAFQKAVDRFTKDGAARVSVTSVDDAEKYATLQVFDGQGTRDYLYRLDTGETQQLGEDVLSKVRGRTATTKPVQFTSRDGLTLNGYMTRPVGIGEKVALPMVLRVHGGPWYRNIWGNTDLPQAANQVQFLANRGYAVLEVNFRGSTGYGRKFMEAAVGQFGKAMQDDLVDAVNWAVGQGFADPKHIAIMGGSYGGYAALMGLADRSSPFACGVALAAPSNLATLIESFPSYWSLDLAQWSRFVGSPSDAAQRREMLAVSPETLASNITKPLLLIHGDEDARVKLEQGTRMHALAAKNGNSVELVVLKNQGHFVHGLKANLVSYRAIEKTLASCLRGRDEGPEWLQMLGFNLVPRSTR